jgi:hypothetical protein
MSGLTPVRITSPPSPAPAPARTRRQYHLWVCPVIAVVAFAALLGLLLAPAAASGDVLEASGSQFGIPPGQLNAFQFTVNQSTTITGSFTSSNEVDVYVMTQAVFHVFIFSDNTTKISSSAYDSGIVTNGSMHVSVPAGAWTIAFLAPSSTEPTHVWRTSALALS